ncbi:MAG: hypothetical protein ACD_63C00064G0005 [uncultured bacterium]|nr:MAG: hypothetical protein ACD_63C00064G0005 [uncultured bacterium]
MTHRIFLALNLPTGVKSGLFKLQYKLNRKELPIRWTVKQNLHMTVLFLGNLNNWELDKACGIADNITSKFTKFEIEFIKISIFKNFRNPRIINVRSKDSSKMYKIYSLLKNNFLKEKMGKIEQQKFKPHVTIGRFIHSDFDKKLLKPWKRAKLSIKVPVESIDILESDMSQKPVEYTLIHRAFLEEL